jgi:hypothetical protein
MAVPTIRDRIIPDAYDSASLRFEGTAPLLHHADTFIDPTHPLTREFKALTAKSRATRTIDDEMNLSRLEWLAGIYHDEDIGPYWPGRNVKRAITKAATRFKKGDPLKHGLIVEQFKIPLEYDGPRDLDALWEEGYRDMCGAVNSGISRGRVLRCRAMFEEWTLTFDMSWDPKACDRDTLERIVDITQVRGLGDRRPEFGTFKAVWL